MRTYAWIVLSVCLPLGSYLAIFHGHRFCLPVEKDTGLGCLLIVFAVMALGIPRPRARWASAAFAASCLGYLFLSLGPGSELPDHLPTSRIADQVFHSTHLDDVFRDEAYRLPFWTAEEIHDHQVHRHAQFLRCFHIALSLILGAAGAILAWLVKTIASRTKPRAAVFRV
jgi:hypothetical protein